MAKRFALQYSVLDKRLGNFIKTYGVSELIKHLEAYDKEYTATDYRLFQELKILACEAYSIPLDELRMAFIKPVHADTRITIAHCAYTNTRLNQEAISKLMEASHRSIGKYINKAQYRIDHPGQFREFYEKYWSIQKVFILLKNDNDNGRKE